MAEKANGRTAQGGITRIEAVRQALGTLGKDATRSDLQKFIKDNYGLQMTLDHISNCKSEIRKGKGGKKPAAAKPPAIEKEAPKQAAPARQDGGIRLTDIERVKDLVERVGADSLKKLIDVMAR